MHHVLSIQSHVAYGHVGNAAAVFPLQRMGIEVWPVHTVQFSNHTGYGAWTGQVFDAGHIAQVLEGMEARGGLATVDAVLSGYLGAAPLGAAVLDAVARVRARGRRALYCCDPVMGDVGRGVFVRPDIPDFFRGHAVPAADIVTPNRFELELLTGRAVATLEDALAAADALRAMGPKVVLVTSLDRADGPADRIEMLAVADDGAFLVATERLPFDPPPNGTGDCTAALFLGRYLASRDAADALGHAATGVFGVLEATKAAGSRELQLVAAQAAFAAERPRFPVTRVRSA